MDKPSKSHLISKLKSTGEQTDFSIIIFSGHGWYSSVDYSTALCLNDRGEEYDSLDLKKNCDKRIIILDCCRVVHPESITEAQKRQFSIRDMLQKGQTQNPEECRKYYSEAVENCGSQILLANSCDISEKSGDSSTLGGYYSSCLLRASKDLVDGKMPNIDINREYSVFSFINCHDNSIDLVERLSGDKQHPQIEKPRSFDSGGYLPFGIVA